MKKASSVLIVFVTIVGLLIFARGETSARAVGATQHFGPFHTTNDPDGGSCGQPWATDTFDRFFTVQDNGDGTFIVTQEFKNGSFVTNGPTSPGACETGSQHGSTVNTGVTGTLHGYLKGMVSGGTYTPNGCDASPSQCTTTAGFIAAIFPGGSYTCLVGGDACRFSFEYAAGDQGLLFHAWKDANNQDGTEYFLGDIANS
jgi:hypothetical protein